MSTQSSSTSQKSLARRIAHLLDHPFQPWERTTQGYEFWQHLSEAFHSLADGNPDQFDEHIRRAMETQNG